MYSLYAYGSMIHSAVRTDAYIEALRRSVTPGSVVLDIGTGCGIWALFACKFGARKVYAIEPGNIIQVAREAAQINGFGERIEFIQDLSTKVALPEPADVMVSDVRGVLPPHESSLASIADARRRLLRPRGIMIPAWDTIWVALVRDEKLHASYVGPWERHGFDLRNFRRRATNLWKKELTPADRLVTPPQSWATLDYTTLESYDVEGAASWTISRDTSAHGLAAWFDSTLIEGVGFSNAPGQPEVIYGRAFFPWPEAVELRAGDVVSVKLRAKSGGEKYIWSWDTSVLRGGRREIRFQQSDFLGEPVIPAELRKRSPQYRPALTEAGEVERQILARINGQASVAEIAQEIYGRFGERFQSLEEVQQAVADVSQRFSR